MSMLIYGIHPVEEILRVAPERVTSLYGARWDGQALQQVRILGDEHGITRHQSDMKALDEMVGGANHQGVIAETQPYQYTALEELIDRTSEKAHACLVILEQVQDPGNLGAIIRSAAAMGADGVIVPKDRAVGVTAAVIRASAGMAYQVPVARVTNVARTLGQLRDHGYWAVGAAAGEGTRSWEMDFCMKTALVMGGEHQGIRRLVAENCDFFVQIPIVEQVESLNVATAASVLLYEIRRQWFSKK